MEPINVAGRAKEVLTEELKTDRWTRDIEKDEEIDFGGEEATEATWTGITYTSDLKWNRHTSRRLTQAERAWGAVQCLGSS